MEQLNDDSSVRVAVRVRPLIGREKVDRCDECIQVISEEAQVVMGKDRSFAYDYVFGKYSQQRDLWTCVEPLIESNFEGYNATIFAYGQTGSGKTYTMGSGSNVNVSEDSLGIIPQVIHYMFEQANTKQSENPEYKIEFQIQFLEIYGEEIRDLLNPFGDSKVALRETESGQVQWIGTNCEVVESSDHCMRLLEKGTLCRTTGSTLMNAHSSRSHAVFTLSMIQHIPTQTEVATEEETNNQPTECDIRRSYFHFVDLAGSERQKRTQAEGKRLKEGIEINKGLLALGNVISALGDEKKRGKVHVPYRDSKLTRMLQDSLGGNSRTLMIACVSPADYNFEESLNALKYANRARNIQNKAVINRDPASAAMANLRQKVELLQAEVLRLRGGSGEYSGEKAGKLMAELSRRTSGVLLDGAELQVMRERCEFAENQVMKLTAQLKKSKISMDSVNESLLSSQTERDYYRLRLEEAGIVINPEDMENDSKMGVLREQSELIAQLQGKLRDSERKVELAQLSNDELIEQAQKEIENENAAVLKAQSESEMAEIEETDTEEAELERVFQKRQQHLGETVHDLSTTITLKEQLIVNLQKSQQNYERMKEFYQQKLVEMTEEVTQAQADREKLLSEIQKAESNNKTETAQHGLRKKLKEKESQLLQLRKKQGEMQKFMQLKNRADQQVKQLHTEVNHMKKQKVDLLKKIQQERKRYEAEAKERKKEIASLKRTSEKDRRTFHKIGAQKEVETRVMRRKLEEATAANRRLKQLKSGNISAEEKRKKEWLGRQIKKLAVKQEQAEKLNVELKKREQIVVKMEKLHGLRNKIQEDFEKHGVSTSIRDVLISPIKPKSQKRRPLSQEEEQTMFELEERIEACQAQLEYKDEKISKIVNDVEDSTDEAAAFENTNSLPEARTLLKMLFEIAVGHKKSNHQKKDQLAAAQASIEALEEQIKQANTTIASVRMNSEEQLSTLQSLYQTTTNDDHVNEVEEEQEEEEEEQDEIDREARIQSAPMEVPIAPEETTDIFQRLANPTNFTGIHKNRMQTGVKKKDQLRDRGEKMRARRLKDRKSNEQRPSTAPSSGRPAAAAAPTGRFTTQLADVGRKLSSVQDIIQHIRKGQADVPTSPRSMARTASSTDVFSRLSGQSTASSQSKQRQVRGLRSSTDSACSISTVPEQEDDEEEPRVRKRSYSASDETELLTKIQDWTTTS